nr:STN domain-containing protein [Acidobacteriota bacterium]
AFAQAEEHSKEEFKQNVVFKDSSQKAALAVLGKQLGLNVIFDDNVKEGKINIELTDVTLKAAMKIIFVQQRLQARLIEDKTIIIFPDNETIRRRYEQYKAWPDEADKKQ